MGLLIYIYIDKFILDFVNSQESITHAVLEHIGSFS